ncbi:MAG: hypothetical protein A3K18_28875 [Lentisphaerae bacterium RIFOXYA12_64_32]|nr:MAG: hypothetical protein A3K18_28875 [Lentisphaerae bacterium RIFOXYA12_64_32]
MFAPLAFAGAPEPGVADPRATAAVAKFGASSAMFVENQGQWEDAAIRFALSSKGVNVGLAESAVNFQVFAPVPGAETAAPPDAPGTPPAERTSQPRRMLRFAASFVGANRVAPTGDKGLGAVVHFRRGKPSHWRENVPTWDSVVYRNLYAGVDLRVTGLNGGMKYEFTVAPGADYRQIALHYEGIAGLALESDGALRLNLGDGGPSLRDAAPVLWQDLPDGRRTVPGAFALRDPTTCGFTVSGPIDPHYPLVIDPAVEWGTYLGGTGDDYATGVAVDSSGNVYVCGYTASSAWVSGGYDTSQNGNYDAFVVKLSSTGAHVWSTYLGGTSEDRATGIAVDGSGYVYVAGYTASSGWVSGGWSTNYGGSRDGFVAKLSSAGANQWSTYLGGSGWDEGNGIAADGDGNVYITGHTSSSGWVSGGWDTSYNGGSQDGFVVKLSSTGAHLWSTYLGGNNSDGGYAVAVDGSGDICVTGHTLSPGWVSGGGITSYESGVTCGFVVRLSGSGAHEWSTYLCGSGEGIALDGSGNVYIAGGAGDSGWVSGGWDTSYNGGDSDGFVAKLSSAGGLVWATYVGGDDGDYGTALALDAVGGVYVAGQTGSSGWVSGGWQTSFDGLGSDGFLVKFSNAGTHIWSSYVTSRGFSVSYDLAVDSARNVYLTGDSNISGWVSGGWSTSYNGGLGDGFLVKVEPGGWLTVTVEPGAARDGGGQWCVDGGPWLNSGAVVAPAVGTHTVSYKDVANRTRPPDATVSIAEDATTSATGTYVELGFSETARSASENAGVIAIPVDLSGPLPWGVTVDYCVTGGTATGGGVDYTLVSGTLTFNSGETSESIEVTLADDALPEPPETVEITLSNPTNAVLGRLAVCILTFADEDTDGDKMSDDWEESCFGGLSQGANEDPDGDADTNVEEYTYGTDPMDADSRVRALLFGCGRNGYGELATEQGSYLLQQRLPWTDIVQVAAGTYHTLIRRADGSLWACGYNYYGQLGDGTTVNRFSPVLVFADGVAAVAGGSYHTLIVESDGSLWACGSNVYGQLGDGTTTSRSTPVQILPGGVASVAAGQDHSLILKTDGSLWACGRNDYGQLGDGTTADQHVPEQILSGGVASVAAGKYHTLIVKTDGSLWACGYNGFGQLGDGTTTNRSTPEQILSDGVTSVAAGQSDSLAVKTDGSLWGWGWNSLGQLGTWGGIVDSPVCMLPSGVASAAPGYDFSVAVKTDGSLWGFGINHFGQCGADRHWIPFELPREVLSGGVAAVAAGFRHALVLRTDGSLWGSGAGNYGQLGDGLAGLSPNPVVVAPFAVDAAALGRAMSGESHTLVLAAGGSLFACGSGYYGELGDGTLEDRFSPVQVLSNVTCVAAGGSASFAVTADGALWGWGGSSGVPDSPVQVLPSSVAFVATGRQHTLAVKTDGSLWAWGDNTYGQLGDGTTTSQTSPVEILPSGVASAAGGSSHTLIVKTDGSLWACGYNYCGQLGDGTTTTRLTPVQILSGGVASVAAGDSFSLVVKTDGSLWTCGYNGSGQLGDGTTTNRSTTVQILSSGVASVSAGAYHSLIVKTDGSLWGCGSNYYGQLHDTDIGTRLSPVMLYAAGVVDAVAGAECSLIIGHPNGGVTVSIEPQAARDAGAQWCLDGGAWQDSGVTVGADTGSHTVSFRDVPNWTKPTDSSVYLAKFVSASAVGTYMQGRLVVTIQQQGARDAGAQWRVDGGAWRDSGATVNLALGNYTISFKDILGWTAAPDRIVCIVADSTSSVASTYALQRLVKGSATGGNTGASWSDAFIDLQSALQAAQTGDEIWVATGTHCPIGGTDRTATFQVPAGVSLYGGFAGTESSRSERDWTAYPTILSGDIGTVSETSDNSYRVVTVDTVADVVLDGFVITGGNANPDSTEDVPRSGGGILCVNATNLSVSHCTVTANSALVAGGGMAVWGGSGIVVSACAFTGNTAPSGGALYSSGSGGTTVCTFTNCVVAGNAATSGAGFYLAGDDAGLVNCTLSGNAASTSGGALYNAGASATLKNCISWGNTAGTGAELCNHDLSGSGGRNAQPVLTCTDIQGGWNGSGVANDGGASVVDGGSNIDADPRFTNTVNAGGADGVFGTVDDGLRLFAGSPCLDAGTPTGAPATDQRGVARPIGAGIDLGAYEGSESPPVITELAPQSVTMDEDSSPTAFSLTLHATDVDGDTLTWSIATPVGHGTATASGTGASQVIGYVPNPNWNGSDSFVVQVSDGVGGTGTITVNVTVNARNDPPVIAQGDSVAATMDEDGDPLAWSAPVLTAMDVDGDTLTWSKLSGPSHGTAAVSGTGASPPTFTYAPAANWNGVDSFAVQVSDGLGGADTIMVNVTVNPRNDAPANTVAPSVGGTCHVGRQLTANNGTWNDTMDTAVSGTSTLTYTYQWRRADSAGGLNAADLDGATSATYNVQGVDNGKYLCVLVTATDNGVGDPATQSTTLSTLWTLVANAVPVITQGTSVARSMDEDGSPLAWSPPTVTATDADGDTLTWSVANVPGHGTATVSGTGASPITFTYAPTANWNGSDSFVIQVSDGLGGVDTITVTVTVNPRNDPPNNTAVPTFSGWHVLTATTGTWNDNTDLVPGALTYTYQWRRADDASGTNAAAIPGATAATYSVQAADVGKYACVRVTATDNGEGLPASQSTSVLSAWALVANAAPVIAQGDSVSASMDEDGAPTVWSAPAVSATDADGDTLTWSVASVPGHGTATVSGTGAAPPTFTYVPAANGYGSDSFVVQVSDGLGGGDTVTVSVTIGPRNDPPVNTVVPTVSGTHQLTATTGTWNDAVDLAPGALTYTYRWRCADSSGGANAADIADATAATYVVQATDVGKYVGVRVTATDDGEGLPLSQSTSASSVWTPIADIAPVIAQGTSVSRIMDEDGSPMTWSAPTLSATDADNDTLTWSRQSGPAHGTATVEGTGAAPTAVVYTPTADWNGSDSFVVRVSDGFGGVGAITVNVTVRARNDAPDCTVAPSVTGTYRKGYTLTANKGTWNDSTDLAPGTLSYAYQWQRADDASGTNAVNIFGVTGTAYTLQAADVGKYVCFRVTTTDNGEGTPTSASTAVLSPWTLVANALPVIVQGDSVSKSMDEDGSPVAWSAPIVSATDADGQTLTWSLASGPGHGTATVSGTGGAPGTFTYAPVANWNGTDSFAVQVSDGAGGTDAITVNVTVNPRQDAPVITESDPQAVTMDEDSAPTTFSLTLHATDPDAGDTLTWMTATPAGHGTATATGTGMSNPIGYTPAADWSGSDSFVVWVTDSTGLTDMVTVNVTVQPRNDAPVSTAAPAVTGVHRLYGALSVNPGTWNDSKDANPVPGLTHQWQRTDDALGPDAANIPGATGTTYALTADDVGRYVCVVETATDTGTPGAATAALATPWVLVEEVLFTLTLSNSAVPELYSGTRTAATNEFDNGLDVVAPANPGAGQGYACFVNAAHADSAERVLTSDFRSASEALTRWRLVVDVPDGGRGTCELGWTLAAVQPGKVIYLQRLDGETPSGTPVDMTATASVPVTADSEFEIAYAVPEQAACALVAGWNLVGIPLLTLESVADVFSDGHGGVIKTGAVWAWDGDRAHVVPDTGVLNAERGCWVYSVAGGTPVAFAGIAADGLIALAPGWNAVSPVRDTVLPFLPGVKGPAWSWDSSGRCYVPVWPGATLQSGRGYWVFVSGAPVSLDTGD